MTTPITYQRLYLNGEGPEYPATGDLIRIAMKSMLDHALGPDPFKLRVRFASGGAVTVRPRAA